MCTTKVKIGESKAREKNVSSHKMGNAFLGDLLAWDQGKGR